MKTRLRLALHQADRQLTRAVATSRLPRSAKYAFGRTHSWLAYKIINSGRLLTSRWPRLPVYQVATLLRPGDVYIDVGASFGELVTVAQQAVGPAGRVYAFEPQPPVFDLLQKKKEGFGWHNVSLTQAVVGDHNGTCTFYVDPSTRLSSLSAAWAKGPAVEYPMVKLDHWAATHGITRASLVKIDVEGAELLVLQGAPSFLAHAKPHLPLEINNRAGRPVQYGYTVDDLLDLLRSLGYNEFYALRASGLARFEREGELLVGDRDMLARWGEGEHSSRSI